MSPKHVPPGDTEDALSKVTPAADGGGARRNSFPPFTPGTCHSAPQNLLGRDEAREPERRGPAQTLTPRRLAPVLGLAGRPSGRHATALGPATAPAWVTHRAHGPATPTVPGPQRWRGHLLSALQNISDALLNLLATARGCRGDRSDPQAHTKPVFGQVQKSSRNPKQLSVLTAQGSPSQGKWPACHPRRHSLT